MRAYNRNPGIEKRLFNAAKSGRSDEVAQILKRYSHINVNQLHSETRSERSATSPLIEAVRENHNDVVAVLLADSRVDVNHVDERGRSPLYHAVLFDRQAPAITKENKAKVVAQLLYHPGVQVNQRNDRYLNTALQRAILSGNFFAVKALLEHPEIDINQTCLRGRTPLHYAAYGRSTKLVRLLLQQPKLETERPDVNNETALDFTEICDYTIKRLLKSCRNITPYSRFLPNNDDNRSWANFTALKREDKKLVMMHLMHWSDTARAQSFFLRMTIRERVGMVDQIVPSLASQIKDLLNLSCSSQLMFAYMKAEANNDRQILKPFITIEEVQPNMLGQNKPESRLECLGDDCKRLITSFLITHEGMFKQKMKVAMQLLRWHKDASHSNNNQVKPRLNRFFTTAQIMAYDNANHLAGLSGRIVRMNPLAYFIMNMAGQ